MPSKLLQKYAALPRRIRLASFVAALVMLIVLAIVLVRCSAPDRTIATVSLATPTPRPRDHPGAH